MLFTITVVSVVSWWSIDCNMTAVSCTYNWWYAILLFKFINTFLHSFSRYWKLYELILFSSQGFLELFKNTLCRLFSQSKLQNAMVNGPDFLWKTEECWPKGIVVSDLLNEHSDVKPEGQILITSHQNALHLFIDHYSSWDRLNRGVAWLVRFKGYLSSCVASRALIRELSKGSS